MSAPKIDALADLRGVVRIAKAASLGVTGNAARIERAEQAIANVAELVEVTKALVTESVHQYDGGDYEEGEWRALDLARAALARFGVTP